MINNNKLLTISLVIGAIASAFTIKQYFDNKNEMGELI